MQTWSTRRWVAAVVGAVATVLVVAVPTDLIDTPLFGREVPPTWWSWPVLLVAAVLSGLLLATYVREPADGDVEDLAASRVGGAGGLLTFFAVGCPVCNKIVLLALGTTGAMQWFEPIQPVLSVLAIGLLGWALRRRLQSQTSCQLPAVSAPRV